MAVSILDVIMPNLFLGSMREGRNLDVLTYQGVTHEDLITVDILIAGKWMQPSFPEKFKYLHLSILDNEDEDIISYFLQSFEFIDNALNNNGRVLVHCAAGVSRSSTIVIAYLMYKQKIPFEQARGIVSKARPILNFFEKSNYAIDIENAEYKRFVEGIQAEKKKAIERLQLPIRWTGTSYSSTTKDDPNVAW